MYLFGEPLHFLADQPASDVLLNVSRRPVFLVAQCFTIPIFTNPIHVVHTVSDSLYIHALYKSEKFIPSFKTLKLIAQ